MRQSKYMVASQIFTMGRAMFFLFFPMVNNKIFAKGDGRFGQGVNTAVTISCPYFEICSLHQ